MASKGNAREAPFMSQIRGSGVNSGALEAKQVIKMSHLRDKNLMK